MAESYKRLGAIAPADDKYKLLYTSPADTEALVSNVTVTNRSAFAQTFDVQVFENGVTQQSDVDDVVNGEDTQPYSPPTQTTLYKTSDIAANSTEILEPGIALAPEGAVVVKDNSGGNLTFSAYGVELSS